MKNCFYTPRMVARTILVVEDDDSLRSLFRTALVVAGYDVREARDGFDALRSLDAAVPDLVVLDLGLPGISGRAVLQELSAQAHTRRIPVMVVTASSERLDMYDVECVLRKPVLPEDLLRAVRTCLASAAPPAI